MENAIKDKTLSKKASEKIQEEEKSMTGAKEEEEQEKKTVNVNNKPSRKNKHEDEAQGQQNHLMMGRIKTVFAYFVDTKRETLGECGAFTDIRKHQNCI